MAILQLVKAIPIRQPLGLSVLGCLLVGCGGGSDIDFSKPPPGMGGGNKKMSWSIDDPASSGSAATQEVSKNEVDVADPAAPAGGDKPSTETASDDPKADETKTAGADTPTKPDAPKKKKKAGIVRITRAANADDAGRFDEDDDDNPFADWRIRPFKFRPIDLPFLRDRRKGSFSEKGTLLAGTNGEDEVVVFRTRFGEVQCLLKREGERPVGVAVSEVTNLALVDYGDVGLRLFDVKDLRRLDKYAREAYYVQQAAMPLVQFSEEELTITQFVQAGKRLLTADQSGVVELRSVEAYTENRTTTWPAELTIQAHETPVLAVCLSKDGEQLVTAARDGAVKVWNTATGELVTEMEAATVPAVALCQIQRGYAIGRANGVLELWTKLDAEQQKLEEILERNPMMITSLQIEPKRRTMVKTLISGAVTLQDPRTGEVLGSQKPHRLGVASVASSPDQLRILTCGTDGRYGSWPAAILKDTTKAPINDPDDIRAPALRFRVGKMSARDDSDDGYSNVQVAMLTAMRDRPAAPANATPAALDAAIKLRTTVEAERDAIRASLPKPEAYTPKAGPRRIQSIKTSFDPVSTSKLRLAVSTSGQTAALAVSRPRGRQDGQLYAWDTTSGIQMRNWTIDRSFERLQFIGNGHWLVPFAKPETRKEEERPTRFDVLSGVAEFGTGNPSSIVEMDGKALIGMEGRYAQSTDFAKLIDLKNSEQLANAEGFESLMPAAAFLSDGTIVASVRERLLSKLVLLSGDTLAQQEEIYSDKVSNPWIQENGHRVNILGITDIALSDDNSTMVTHGQYSHNDFRFVIWKRKSGRFEEKNAKGVKDSKSFLIKKKIVGPKLSFVGRGTILALTEKGLVKIDAESGKVQSQIPLPEGDSMFDPTGKWLISHDGTGSIEVRTLAKLDRQQLPAKFRAHDAPVVAMACSQDGRYLVTVGEENKLNVWDFEGWAPKPPKRK